jgi:DNA-binding GntR family transcriptional regulator
VFLINYDLERVIDIYRAREALEGMAARLAAERVSDREIENLHANINQQRKFLKDNDIDAYYNAAVAFHEQIVRIARNNTMQRMLESVFAQIRAMRVQRNSAPMHLPKSCDDHEEILRALEKRKGDLAETLMRDHIRDLTKVLKQEGITKAGAEDPSLTHQMAR